MTLPQKYRSRRARLTDLSRQLRADGRTWAQIALHIRQTEQVNRRVAMRLAHGLTQTQVARIWNERWPSDPATPGLTDKNISYWETWPQSGHEPSLKTLKRLAQIYQCDVGDLIDDGSYSYLDECQYRARTVDTTECNTVQSIREITGKDEKLSEARERVPNLVLRGIRENERGESREQFAEAMAAVARDMGYEIIPDAKYVDLLESGKIAFPGPAYRSILSRLCSRPVAELGFRMPTGSVTAREANPRLRDVMFCAGIEPRELARKVGVDPKSVERWMTRGIIPHARHRYLASKFLNCSESELWPATVPTYGAPNLSQSETLPAPLRSSFASDMSDMVEAVKRREFLWGLTATVGGATGIMVPAFKHVDPELIPYFRQQLEGHYRADMLLGPRALISTVTAQCKLIGQLIDSADEPTRQRMAGVGTSFASFAAWLYRAFEVSRDAVTAWLLRVMPVCC